MAVSTSLHWFSILANNISNFHNVLRICKQMCVCRHVGVLDVRTQRTSVLENIASYKKKKKRKYGILKQ